MKEKEGRRWQAKVSAAESVVSLRSNLQVRSSPNSLDEGSSPRDTFPRSFTNSPSPSFADPWPPDVS